MYTQLLTWFSCLSLHLIMNIMYYVKFSGSEHWTDVLNDIQYFPRSLVVSYSLQEVGNNLA